MFGLDGNNPEGEKGCSILIAGEPDHKGQIGLYHQKLMLHETKQKELDVKVRERMRNELDLMPPYLYTHFVGTEPNVKEVCCVKFLSMSIIFQMQQKNKECVSDCNIQGSYLFFQQLYTEWNNFTR